MELKELIHPLEVLEVVGNTDVEISGIQSDSRKVEKAFLFVAVRGTTVDGHDYIQSAIGRGCRNRCEEIPALSDEDIQVSEANRFYPGERFGGCFRPNHFLPGMRILRTI